MQAPKCYIFLYIKYVLLYLYIYKPFLNDLATVLHKSFCLFKSKELSKEK